MVYYLYCHFLDTKLNPHSYINRPWPPWCCILCHFMLLHPFPDETADQSINHLITRGFLPPLTSFKENLAHTFLSLDSNSPSHRQESVFDSDVVRFLNSSSLKLSALKTLAPSHWEIAPLPPNHHPLASFLPLLYLFSTSMLGIFDSATEQGVRWTI